jgi:transcriptional regulator with XRE-family HTH domain
VKLVYVNLKLQLWKTGMRQNQLARAVGMDQTNLSKIVNGFREASPEVRRQIASVLKCDEEWLFEQSEGPKPEDRGAHAASH